MPGLWTDPGRELSVVFPPLCIETFSATTDKSLVIRLLVQSLSRENDVVRVNSAEIIEALLESERQLSSAIRGGVALPYLEVCDVAHRVGAIGLAPDGLDFDSSDGQPTRLVFLMLVPPSEAEEATRLRTWLANFGRAQITSPSADNLIRPDQFIHNLIHADPAA